MILGNMTPYVSSYVAKYFDKDFNKGLVVWMSAAPLMAQGFFMPLGGIFAPRIGARLVIIIGCAVNR